MQTTRVSTDKKYRTFYVEAIKALDRLTHKRLGYRMMVSDKGDPCVVGAFRIHESTKGRVKPGYKAMYAAYIKFSFATATPPGVINVNDDFVGTPEARWKYMRKWLTKQLAHYK